jgi:hypothetical protein
MSDTFAVVGREGAERIATGVLALTAGVTELRNAGLANAPAFTPVWGSILTAATVLEGESAGE